MRFQIFPQFNKGATEMYLPNDDVLCLLWTRKPQLTLPCGSWLGSGCHADGASGSRVWIITTELRLPYD